MNNSYTFQASRSHTASSAIRLLSLIIICFAYLTGCATHAAQNQPTGTLQQDENNAPASKSINEQDYTIHAPKTAWGGEPFTVSVTGNAINQVTFTWRNKSVTVQAGKNGQSSNTCEAIFATPLDTKDTHGNMIVIVTTKQGKKDKNVLPLLIANRKYPVQKLTVDAKYVTPPASVLAKIKQDRQQLRAVVTQVTPQKHWEIPFERPVPGKISSIFGLRREFNGQPKNPHKGLDFRAKAGDPIAAVEAGTVALVADHYYGGNTVIVDHGLGLYSLYLHMSAFDVTQGQQVTRGQTLGRIGSTGRSTGPHLHLSFMVMGESVDPAPSIANITSAQ